jgi:hypothetical protein
MLDMTTQTLKVNIRELLEVTDNQEVLKGIYILLRQFAASKAAFITEIDADGNMLTEEEFIRSILEADAEIEAGNFSTLAEFESKHSR